MTSSFAFESITLANKASYLSPLTYAPKEGHAQVAFITCEGEARWRVDGGEPTSTSGHLLRDGSFLILQGDRKIQQFRAVNAGLDHTVLQISYERD